MYVLSAQVIVGCWSRRLYGNRERFARGLSWDSKAFLIQRDDRVCDYSFHLVATGTERLDVWSQSPCVTDT